MSKLVTLVTAATAAVILSASFASAGQIVVKVPTRIGHTVSLACSAGHGDVAQTIYVQNTAGKTLPAGTKVSWTLNGLAGSFNLQNALANGQSASDLAPAGNGGTCKASVFIA